jgi:membrane protein YqaA with SNARE-associated domain
VLAIDVPAIRSGDGAVPSRDVSAVIVRIAALILIVGGGLGALLGYAVAHWLDQRRKREEWRRETEWLGHEDPERRP